MFKKIISKFFKKKEAQMTEKNTEKTPAANQTDATPDGKISIDEFAKVEMRVGEIISAEKVENADRLLRLEVMFGEEKRQIVSGIAEFVTPEELIGQKTTFVTNLAPRNIRGLESNGMILAAKDASGSFGILKVDQKIASGTKLG